MFSGEGVGNNKAACAETLTLIFPHAIIIIITMMEQLTRELVANVAPGDAMLVIKAALKAAEARGELPTEEHKEAFKRAGMAVYIGKCIASIPAHGHPYEGCTTDLAVYTVARPRMHTAAGDVDDETLAVAWMDIALRKNACEPGSRRLLQEYNLATVGDAHRLWSVVAAWNDAKTARLGDDDATRYVAWVDQSVCGGRGMAFERVAGDDKAYKEMLAAYNGFIKPRLLALEARRLGGHEPSSDVAFRV